jgi:hypothetical protein
VPCASQRRSAAAGRHADTVRFVLFEARPARLAGPVGCRKSRTEPHRRWMLTA